MSGFPAKLMAAVVVIFLLVGDVRTTSSLLPYGGRKSLWLLQSREVTMKMVPREDGSTEGLNVGSRQIASVRSLRATASPPPPPTKNKMMSTIAAVPPPPV